MDPEAESISLKAFRNRTRADSIGSAYMCSMTSQLDDDTIKTLWVRIENQAATGI
jgi:hypothetical protein